MYPIRLFLNEIHFLIFEFSSFSATIWQKSGKSQKTERFWGEKTKFRVWLKRCGLKIFIYLSPRKGD